jgi:signal transduction histidine kinase
MPAVPATARVSTGGVLRHVFEPFFTAKEVGKGSNQGLAVVHGIVSLHLGAITVDSAAGVGTTFVVFFLAAREPVTLDASDDGKAVKRDVGHIWSSMMRSTRPKPTNSICTRR